MIALPITRSLSFATIATPTVSPYPLTTVKVFEEIPVTLRTSPVLATLIKSSTAINEAWSTGTVSAVATASMPARAVVHLAMKSSSHFVTLKGGYTFLLSSLALTRVQTVSWLFSPHRTNNRRIYLEYVYSISILYCILGTM